MNGRVHIFVRLCSYSQHSEFLFRHRTSKEKEAEEEEDKSMDKREIEWETPWRRYIGTEATNEVHSENRATDTVPKLARARARGVRTTPVGFLVHDDYKRSSTIASALFFLVDYFFHSDTTSSSPLLFLPPSSIPFLSLAWVNCSWDSSGSHSGVNSFTPLLIPFLYFEVYRMQ